MDKLTFAMIVRNAASDLPEILPLMGRIASEMIVVDTGSDDGTHLVAANLGARVIQHPWNDSFAEARNVYVEAAKYDWIFSIDADERIAERDLHLINAAAQETPRGFLMTTRNYRSPETAQGFVACRGEYPELERGFKGWAPSTKVRMFPRRVGVRYAGAVRELLEPSLENAGLPLGEILAPIHHFGAVTPEKMAYYRELLQIKCVQDPQNPRSWLELATEDFHLGRFEEAATGMQRAVDLFKAGQRAPYFDPGGALNTLGVALIRLGRPTEALAAFDEGLAKGGSSTASLQRNRELLRKKMARSGGQHMDPAQPRTNATLGVVMIVRDEERNLAGILSDAQAFADELVVVDTGSTDYTVKIAESFGARVGHFAWSDDFAAARNHAIGLSRSDYLLWLDADDRIDEAEGRRLRELKSQLDTACFLKIESATDEAAASGDGHTAFYQLRIFPRREDVRFRGRVHEELATAIGEAGITPRRLDITIRHTGYHDAPSRLAKGRRNLAIQLKALAGGRDDAEQHYMIAASYFAVKDYAQSLKHIGIARHKGGGGLWRKYAYHMACDCHLNLGQPQEALHELEEGVRAYPESGLMHYFLGALLVREQHYARAQALLAKAQNLSVEQETFAIPTDINVMLPYYLGLACQKGGDLESAEAAYRQSLGVNPLFEPALGALGVTLLQQGRVEQALDYLEAAHKIDRHSSSLPALAGAYYYLQRYDEARELYRRAARRGEPASLSGLLLACLRLDDLDGLVEALERLMKQTHLETDREIQGLEELAGLIAATGIGLLEQGETLGAERLAEAAAAITPEGSGALLLQADLARQKGDTTQALSHLEKALRCGADAQEVEDRLTEMENRQSGV